MSKIGKKPVSVKEGVSAQVQGHEVKITGPKGSLLFKIPNGVSVDISENKIQISQKNKNKEENKALYGLTRSMINNMVIGVSEGFEKRLELSGVGYRAQIVGADLTLHLGFSHPVKITPPEGIKLSVAENNIIISGMDKALVGDIASKIRSIRPPEPYKGKGIKYKGEKIRRKAGKAAKAVGTK
ncbi:MAG: 50S ribosomal protein L6 [Candidatus Levybacteria bacterium]|nr:50S ribosomal protein L6 [Candidatus Levybacteria bacterium]